MHLTPAGTRNSLAAGLVSHFRPLNVFAIRLETENTATSPFDPGVHRLATARLPFSGSNTVMLPEIAEKHSVIKRDFSFVL
jgi:hypothetical protein